MNKLSELNNQRNKCMDEIIDIEEVKHPKLYREMKSAQGKIAILTSQKRILWTKIKNIHKEIKGGI